LTNVNRYNGDRIFPLKTVLVTVPSAVTVEQGDFMFIDNTGNLRNNGDSSPTFKAYPFEYLRRSGSTLELNQQEARNRFLGVSLDDKDGISGGVDQSLVVATAGKFNFDLKPGFSVINGDYFGPSGTTTGSDMFNQKVARTVESD